ncbi:MAG: hypothetical protein HUU57_17270 [Bdellovibrio sp.]|nr:hypothetical protein [Bdellovibrio sp.]
MQKIISLLRHIFKAKPFYYGWEQRAYERRQEQYFTVSQNACRPSRD